MPINFPDSPTTGDTHTVGDKTWTYDGTAWTLVTGATADHGNLDGLADDDHPQYLLADGTRSATGTITATAFSGPLTGNVTGNADTATKLATARTITLGTDLSGSVSFDGSANVTLNATVADDSHNHIISNVDGLQTALDAKQAAATALTTTTTFGGDVSGTYNAIVVADDSHNHVISNVDGLQTALDGKLGSTANAVSASKLETARTISLTGDVTGSVSFDGSANASITATVADDSHNHITSNIDGLEEYIEDVVAGSLTAGSQITVTYDDVANTLTLAHADTSTQASVNNSNGTVIQDVTVDGNGHITALGSVDLDGRYYTETEADARFLRGDTSDTMSGSLTVAGAAANDNTPEISITGNGWAAFHASLGQGSFNGIVQAGDKGVIFSDGTSGTGNLAIAPWGGTGGIRINSSGNVGVKLASPAYSLDVSGDINASGAVRDGGVALIDGYARGSTGTINVNQAAQYGWYWGATTFTRPAALDTTSWSVAAIAGNSGGNVPTMVQLGTVASTTATLFCWSVVQQSNTVHMVWGKR